jgi:uncharacterized membrane protein YkvI
MRNLKQILQIAFTYMGTIVGAGFATGKEILLFFTRYGWVAVATIGIATVLFVWVGCKLMMIAHEIGAESYEDLNKELFGPKIGDAVSLFTLLTLFGVTSVMLAAAGSLFQEHMNLHVQVGLFLTVFLTYLLLNKGMAAILAVNSVVVPIMILFTAAIVWITMRSPGSGNWVTLQGDLPWHKAWFSPILYTSYNLAMAQAVLVPLGKAIHDKKVLYWGGIAGGAGIGLLLLACHYTLSAQMPGIIRYEIPMGHLIQPLGRVVQLLYVLVIFGEILTTFLSNVYGLGLQLKQRSGLRMAVLVPIILLCCYLISQIGFGRLLEVLYPLFGVISLVWFVALIYRRRVWIRKA